MQIRPQITIPGKILFICNLTAETIINLLFMDIHSSCLRLTFVFMYGSNIFFIDAIVKSHSETFETFSNIRSFWCFCQGDIELQIKASVSLTKI